MVSRLKNLRDGPKTTALQDVYNSNSASTYFTSISARSLGSNPEANISVANTLYWHSSNNSSTFGQSHT